MGSSAPPGGGGNLATPDRSLYAVLNVRPDATDDEIRRAYRHLATTYHPDKAQDPALLNEAAEAFTRVQEAYEILSDPAKRDIYDVYGLEGVRSGWELAVPGKRPEELRREWREAQEKRRKEEAEAAVSFRGQYIFRIDSTALVAPYDRTLRRTPELTSISMTTGVDVPIESAEYWGPVLSSAGDSAHLGGFVFVRGDHGGGSFMAGYKRVYSDTTSLEFNAMMGLRTLVSGTAGWQLGAAARGAMTVSWQPKTGVGLQVATTRQLGESTSGELAWTLGPQEEAGMALSVVHRIGETAQVSGRVEVGAATGLTLRAAKRVGEECTARAGVKLGLSGVEVDVGASRRISDISTAGASVVTGLSKGILLRLRYARGGHSFEFPILVYPTLSVPAVLAAHLLPPLVYYLASRWVAGPLQRAVEARRTAAGRQATSAEVEAGAKSVAAAARLMAPVAKRKIAREAASNGLVVVLALYGEEEAVKKAALTELRLATATVNALAEEEEGSGGSAGTAAATAEGTAPPYVNVTTALQYFCDNGRVVLHQGYSKAGLMGFCDPAPSATKLLVVYFNYRGKAQVARIMDAEGSQLPGSRSSEVTDPEEAELVAVLAAKASAAAAAVGGPSPPASAAAGAAAASEAVAG